MALKRIILEMGSGNDLQGEDYTKAAIRAVQDAMHHSYLPLFQSLDIDRESMSVEVTVGVQKPEKVDTEVVGQQIPYGQVKVNCVKGGLNVEDREKDTISVIATAAVAARIDIPEGRYRSSAMHQEKT